MTTTLTREEAAQILATFLEHRQENEIRHVRTYPGPGYPIEDYSSETINITWGEDDPDFDLTEFWVGRKGETNGHGFSHEEAKALREPQDGQLFGTDTVVEID